MSTRETGEAAAARGGHGTALRAILTRDRAVTLAGLALLSAVAWGYVAHLASAMRPLGASMLMPQTRAWDAGELAALFAMWAVMMVAMMLPSAAPVVLLVADVERKRRERRAPAVPTTVFLLGYLLVWTAYSALAASLQLALHQATLLSPAMAASNPALAGSILVAAGIYQWTPLKRTCLAHCRSPLHVLSSEWREGFLGALRLGLRHGTYCVGCCWLLMALLFVGGVMNLAWVAVLAGLVLVEKAVRRGRWIGRATGLGLIAWGAGLVMHGLLLS